SEQKSAMASVTLNHTIEQAMSVENEGCASRLCSADMQEALAAFFVERRPAGSQCVRQRCVASGSMRALQPSGYLVQPRRPVLSLSEPTTACTAGAARATGRNTAGVRAGLGLRGPAAEPEQWHQARELGQQRLGNFSRGARPTHPVVA